nr:hypothetical protein [Tanacetum cinerariifolium]
MDEYIKLEEEKARRRGKVYNWETATYGKISFLDDFHDLKSVDTKFLAIVFDDTFTSEAALSHEPTLISLNNNEIDFRISFDESEDEDCMDNDDNEINITQSFGDMAPLPPRDQRHLWLRYQVVGYTEEIVHDFKQRLETIFGRQVNRVHILDFEGLTLDMREIWLRVQEFILKFFSTCRIGSEMGLDVADTLCFQLGGDRHSMT